MKIDVTEYEKKYTFELKPITQLCGQNIPKKSYILESIRRYFSAYKYSEERNKWRNNVKIDDELAGRKFFTVLSVSGVVDLLMWIKWSKQSLMVEYVRGLMQEFDWQLHLRTIHGELEEMFQMINKDLNHLGDIELTYAESDVWEMVHVKRCYYGYKDGIMKSEDEGEYQTDYWRYTDDGYLMFSGTYFSEELYVLTLSSAEEHVAFRILPLDAKCRELNEKYLLPIGYELNNMFLVDWNEDDFGDLNFYDMFDLLYPKLHNEKFPYVADDNLGIGAVYHIPKTEFENVIMEYFNIDSETLQSKTVYDSEDSTYEYKPRGFEEVEYPEYPYSEVIGYTENSDGTITLTANVVFPYSGNSKVYAHEVVIRPLEDGRVQYVSNRIIPSEDNSEETWHTPRLTAEEWEELYGGE